MGLLHRDLHYLSDRLALDLIQHASSTKGPKWSPGAALGIPGGPSVTLTPEPRTERNRHRLADEALRCAEDEAGTLADPGRYLRIENCRFALWVFSFKGQRSRQPIALAMCQDPSSSLAILVGRANNVFGFSSELPIDGWIPSDPRGLHYLARYADESDFDPKTAALFRPENVDQQAAFFGEDPPDLVADAASIAASILRTPDLAGKADVLARVHEYADNVEVVMTTRGYRQTAPRVVVGAPVFIREPIPVPLPGSDPQ